MIGDDRRLDGVHPRRESQRFRAWLSRTGGWPILASVISSPCRCRRPRFRLAGAARRDLVRSCATVTAARPLQSPEQFIGFKVGADNKLARWDKIVEYMKLAAAELGPRPLSASSGKTNGGNPFIALEISVARHAEEPRPLQAARAASCTSRTARRATRERDEIFRQGKVVVLVTCSVHATEIGATQMALELVHRSRPTIRRRSRRFSTT